MDLAANGRDTDMKLKLLGALALASGLAASGGPRR